MEVRAWEVGKSEGPRRLLINASIEASEFAVKRRHDFGSESVLGCLRTLRSYKESYPQIYADVRRQRKSKKFHWSGLSRTALVKNFTSDLTLYSGLSWEVHAVMAPVRDVSMHQDREGYVIVSELSGDLEEQAEWQAYTVGGMLYELWDEFATIFGLTKVLLDGENGATGA